MRRKRAGLKAPLCHSIFYSAKCCFSNFSPPTFDQGAKPLKAPPLALSPLYCPAVTHPNEGPLRTWGWTRALEGKELGYGAGCGDRPGTESTAEGQPT